LLHGNKVRIDPVNPQGLQRTLYFTGRDIAISQVEISPAATPRDIIRSTPFCLPGMMNPD
jgi:hypothetical protein